MRARLTAHKAGRLETATVARFTEEKMQRTKEESAELVLRSMVADMRRQGWTISNQDAENMVASIKSQLLNDITEEI